MPRQSAKFVPVYRQLFERYRDEILNFRFAPGERIASISELQMRHNIGRETAKKVLKLLVDEGYVVQMQGRGSYVRDLGPRQKVWGLVFPFFSIQYEDLILHIASQAQAMGRDFRHFCNYNSYEEEIRLVANMIEERYEAVVVIPTMDESRSWEAFYSHLPVTDSSVVLLDHTMTSNDFRFVVQSYDLGVTRALLYMLDQKPGGIALVENELWGGRNMVIELMRATYRYLLAKHRPDFEPVILGQATLINGARLSQQGVTGVLCCDDVSAVHTVGRLKEQGYDVPGDFNVVGYGNTPLSRFFTPPITSVDPRNAEMAEVLCRFLTQTPDTTPPSHQQYVVQPELIVRCT